MHLFFSQMGKASPKVQKLKHFTSAFECFKSLTAKCAWHSGFRWSCFSFRRFHANAASESTCGDKFVYSEIHPCTFFGTLLAVVASSIGKVLKVNPLLWHSGESPTFKTLRNVSGDMFLVLLFSTVWVLVLEQFGFRNFGTLVLSRKPARISSSEWNPCNQRCVINRGCYSSNKTADDITYLRAFVLLLQICAFIRSCPHLTSLLVPSPWSLSNQ